MSILLFFTKILHFSRHTFLILALIITYFYILIMMGSIFKAPQSLSICGASTCWYFPTLVEHTWCRGGKKTGAKRLWVVFCQVGVKSSSRVPPVTEWNKLTSWGYLLRARRQNQSNSSHVCMFDRNFVQIARCIFANFSFWTHSCTQKQSRSMRFGLLAVFSQCIYP